MKVCTVADNAIIYVINCKAYHSCWHALFVLSSRSRSQSSCYSPHFARHTAEMRYPEAWYSALVLNVIPQKCAIHSHCSRLRPARHTAEMRYPVAWHSALVLNVIPQKCAIHSHCSRLRPARHTAEMRYPVAWHSALVLNVIPQKCAIHSHFLPPLPRPSYRRNAVSSSLVYSVRFHCPALHQQNLQ